jgi:hypothetical protein
MGLGLMIAVGSSRANGLHEERLGLGAGNSGLSHLTRGWLPHESAAIEGIGWLLTRSGCRRIVRGIPEGHVLKEISLIREIPEKQ